MEDDMTAALKSLTFITLPKPGANPALDRRLKVIARLEEQMARFSTTPTIREPFGRGPRRTAKGL
jgi:hypothetical protein